MLNVVYPITKGPIAKKLKVILSRLFHTLSLENLLNSLTKTLSVSRHKGNRNTANPSKKIRFENMI